MDISFKKIEAQLTKLYQILNTTEKTVRVKVTYNGETDEWPIDDSWVEGWIEEARAGIGNNRKKDIFWDRRFMIANAVWEKLHNE